MRTYFNESGIEITERSYTEYKKKRQMELTYTRCSCCGQMNDCMAVLNGFLCQECYDENVEDEDDED